MPIGGTFLGLDIGASALAAAQVGEQVTGNNIANANTPGYTDESVSLMATPPLAVPSIEANVHAGQIGTGVMAQSVLRSTDQFLDAQVVQATSQNGQQGALSTWLQNVQGAFNEPSSSGINQALTQFYANFTQLQSNPSDTSVRAAVISGGATLAQVFQTTNTNLTQAGQQLNTQINNDMTSINSMGQQIAALNVEIRQAVAQNQQPNQLEDQRQLLLTNLAKLVNVSTTNNADGTVSVAIGSSDLVNDIDSSTVDLPTLQARGDLQSGEVSGLVQAQTNLASYQNKLNTLANTVITDVNALQAGGTDSNGVVHPSGMGLDGSTAVQFFNGTDASNISVNQTLVNNPQELAAGAIPPPPATTPPPGDSSVAQAIASLQNAPSNTLGKQSPLQYYQQLIAQVGGDAKSAQTSATDSGAALTQLSNQQASVEGVNLDQEMTNMLQYQRAYEAAAKIVSTQDSMLNTLINGMMANH